MLKETRPYHAITMQIPQDDAETWADWTDEGFHQHDLDRIVRYCAAAQPALKGDRLKAHVVHWIKDTDAFITVPHFGFEFFQNAYNDYYTE
jgi:hypothetical protein